MAAAGAVVQGQVTAAAARTARLGTAQHGAVQGQGQGQMAAKGVRQGAGVRDLAFRAVGGGVGEGAGAAAWW